jgi:hypothetical protein
LSLLVVLVEDALLVAVVVLADLELALVCL